MITQQEIEFTRFVANNITPDMLAIQFKKTILDAMDEIERLQAQLRAATLVVGNDPDTFDWGTLSKIDEQEREIARLRNELAHEHNELLTVAEADKAMIEWLRTDLAAALKRAEAAERELYVLRVSNKHAVEIWRKRLKAKTK